MANHWTTRMRLLLLTLGIALIFHPFSRAQEGNWWIDPLHSGAHFSVRHMMISTVRGEFTGVTGQRFTIRRIPRATAWKPPSTAAP
jgi:polyisoprenoid-binding protein YceI